MSDGQAPHRRQVLTTAMIEQLNEKVAEAMRIGYATVELVIEKGELRWVRGPTPSEPVRMR
jgi:hypothetical protein